MEKSCMDKKMFLELVFPIKQKVFRLAKRLLTSTEEAEDATQEVLLKMWNKRQEFQKYNNIEAVMMTITKNHCLDRLKSKQASNVQLTHNNYLNYEANLDKQTEDKDDLKWVEKIINRLPETQKIIIQLREIEELEFGQIAEILQITEINVRVTLSRARKTIRKEMIKIRSYGTA